MEKSKVLAAINRAFPNFLIVENEKTIALNDDSCICFKSRLIDNDFVGFVGNYTDHYTTIVKQVIKNCGFTSEVNFNNTGDIFWFYKNK